MSYRQPLSQTAQQRIFGAPCDTSRQVAATLPILGRVTVHRLVAPQLERILAAIERDGLASHLWRADFGGVYSCRQMRTGGGHSKHAWATAIDLNVHEQPRGTRGAAINHGLRGEFPHLRRLLPYFVAEGWSAGLQWQRVPDPMHFEATSGGGTGLLAGGTLRGIDPAELALTYIDLAYLRGYPDCAAMFVPQLSRRWELPGGAHVPYRLDEGRAVVLVADVARSLGWSVDTADWPLIRSRRREATHEP